MALNFCNLQNIVIFPGIPSPTYTWFKDGFPLPAVPSSDPKYQNTSYSYDHNTGVLVFAVIICMLF